MELIQISYKDGCFSNVNNNSYVKNLESTIAIGNFDSVHLGHQELLKTTVFISKQNYTIPSALIFDPHPTLFIQSLIKQNFNNQISFIQSIKDKIKAIFEIGIKRIYLIKFNSDFMEMTPEEFVLKTLKQRLNAKHIVTGYNFYFGNNKSGNKKSMTELCISANIKYTTINEISVDHIKLSSSNIKNYMKTGSVGIVNKMLGKEYYITGIVKTGRKAATKFFQLPTANIHLPVSDVEHYIQYPTNGVYIIKVTLPPEYDTKQKFGIANLGMRPTVNNDNNDNFQKILEVHIFDFQKDLYEKEIKVEFIEFLRPERKFDSMESLASQIKTDVKNAKYFINTYM